MKIWGLFPIVSLAAVTVMADEPFLSNPVKDVVKLSQAGMSAPVMESYVRNSPVAYSPTVDEILYMKKQGVPDGVVADMLKHGTELRNQPGAVQPSSAGVPSSGFAPTANRASEAVTPGVPVPATQAPMVPDAGYAVGYDYPAASPGYYYPYYGYPYYDWPYVGVGIGWGWGWYQGGWHYRPGWGHGHSPGWGGGHGGWHGGWSGGGHAHSGFGGHVGGFRGGGGHGR